MHSLGEPDSSAVVPQHAHCADGEGADGDEQADERGPTLRGLLMRELVLRMGGLKSENMLERCDVTRGCKGASGVIRDPHTSLRLASCVSISNSRDIVGAASSPHAIAMMMSGVA